VCRILFIAPFPDEQNSKEGMLQRIWAIDQLFSSEERLYLDISFTKNFLYTKATIASKAKGYRLNYFLHFPIIFFLFWRWEVVYCHSVLNYLKIALLAGLTEKKVVLDMHGIVPEEKLVERRQLLSFFYSCAEKLAFRATSLAVHVSKQMKAHYIKKYPAYKGKHIIYAIIPAHLRNPELQKPILNSETRTNSNKVVIIYSGNTQIWQNIELMLRVIKKNNQPQLRYLILTGEPAEMRSMINKFDLTEHKIEVKSVAPEQLFGHYQKAHYGFILRDDIPINRVANPTKMIEYLNYGIIPIVNSPNIGDFLEMNYEFVNYEHSFQDLPAVKSEKNMQIAKDVINMSNEHQFKLAVLSRNRVE
jgi:hypothetical protein